MAGHEFPSRRPHVILNAITAMAGKSCEFDSELDLEARRMLFTEHSCDGQKLDSVFQRLAKAKAKEAASE